MDPKFYYIELLDEVLNSYNENSIDELVKKKSINNNISNKINAESKECVLKGVSNYEQLNCGGLNDNYDYEENDTKIKELSDELLSQLSITEENLNIEAIEYSNFIENINIKKNNLFINYQQQLKILKDNYDKEILELENNSKNNKNFKNIDKIINLISDSQENISRYYCEINTIDKIIKNMKKNIQNFINIKNNNYKSEFTEELELEELQNINEEIFLKMENRIKNNYSNNIYYISLNNLVINLENQKKEINDNISKEQLNINKITFLLMKNRWFETAKIVDAKITSLIDSIKKNYILTADEAQENNFDTNFLQNQINDYNGLDLNDLQDLDNVHLPDFNKSNKNSNLPDFLFNNTNNYNDDNLITQLNYNRINKFNLQNP